MQVLDRCAHDVELRREVMQHRAARETGLSRRLRSWSSPHVAELDEAAQRRLDDLQSRRRALLCLASRLVRRRGFGRGVVALTTGTSGDALTRSYARKNVAAAGKSQS